MYSLIARWNIIAGQETAATKALKTLAAQVKKHEPGTLIYLIHMPDMQGFNVPTPSPTSVTFLEVYKNKKAFLAHLAGPVYTQFVAKYKDLFLNTTVNTPDGRTISSPFVIVETLSRLAGFVREGT